MVKTGNLKISSDRKKITMVIGEIGNNQLAKKGLFYQQPLFGVLYVRLHLTSNIFLENTGKGMENK